MYAMRQDFLNGPGKDGNKNVVVFHGWKSNWLNKGSKKGKGEEFDCLVVSKSLKIIMNIEVKNTLSMSTTRKLCKQLSSKSAFFLNRYIKHRESQC